MVVRDIYSLLEQYLGVRIIHNNCCIDCFGNKVVHKKEDSS